MTGLVKKILHIFYTLCPGSFRAGLHLDGARGRAAGGGVHRCSFESIGTKLLVKLYIYCSIVSYITYVYQFCLAMMIYNYAADTVYHYIVYIKRFSKLGLKQDSIYNRSSLCQCAE